jgi:hypothetical protein
VHRGRLTRRPFCIPELVSCALPHDATSTELPRPSHSWCAVATAGAYETDISMPSRPCRCMSQNDRLRGSPAASEYPNRQRTNALGREASRFPRHTRLRRADPRAESLTRINVAPRVRDWHGHDGASLAPRTSIQTSSPHPRWLSSQLNARCHHRCALASASSGSPTSRDRWRGSARGILGA